MNLWGMKLIDEHDITYFHSHSKKKYFIEKNTKNNKKTIKMFKKIHKC